MEAKEVSNSGELHLFAIGTSSKPKPLTCEVIVKGITEGYQSGLQVSYLRDVLLTETFTTINLCVMPFTVLSLKILNH